MSNLQALGWVGAHCGHCNYRDQGWPGLLHLRDLAEGGKGDLGSPVWRRLRWREEFLRGLDSESRSFTQIVKVVRKR